MNAPLSLSDYAGSLIHAPHGTTSLDDGSSELCSEGTNLQFVDVQGFTVNLTEESDTHSFGDLFFLHASASAVSYAIIHTINHFD